MKLWITLAIGTAALGTTYAFGQGEGREGGQSAAKKPIQATSGPLTVGEMNATIEKLEIAIRRVVLANSQAPMSHPAVPDRPATRSEVIAEFWRLYQLAKPNFKFTPRPVNLQVKSISIPTDNAQRKPLEALIKHGFIGKVSPLAAGSGDSLTLSDYGDALGFFLSRISDLTHTPSSRWSPYMFNHRDGG